MTFTLLHILLVFASITLVCYWLYFLSALLESKGKKDKKNNESPEGVSVIVCAKNEAENLSKLIPEILAQDHPLFELIIVDDQSRDNTKKIVAQLQSSHENGEKLRYLKFDRTKKSKGKKEVLAFGIESANYDQLVLTDADCLPTSRKWVSLMSSQLDESNMVLGIGLYKANSLLSRFVRLDSILIAIQYLASAVKKQPYMSVGRNLAYKKSLYESTGGFMKHLELSSGDDDLFIQESKKHAQCTVQLSSEAHTISDAPKTWRAFFRQKSRHQSTGVKYSASSLFYLGFYQFSIFVFYFSSFYLIISGFWVKWTILIILLKKSVQAGVFRRIFVKIGVADQSLAMILFELPWLAFTGLVNIRSLFFSKSKW